MDSRERELAFREIDRRYAELKRQLDAGIISTEEFAAHRQELMVQDDEGRWWAKIGQAGEWYYHDGTTWVQGTPPGNQEVIQPTSTPAPTPVTPRPEGAESGDRARRSVARWIPVAGVVGLTRVVMVATGIALTYSVLVPYLQGEPASSNQGEPMQGNQNEPAQGNQNEPAQNRDEPAQNNQDEPAQGPQGQDEPAPEGVAIEAVFVHRATAENIAENWTYLDHPLINENPNAIIVVTQNWNPGNRGGIYNDHPIGVWYDDSRERWAIFNQDEEDMPEGAAFNVAILEGPEEAR